MSSRSIAARSEVWLEILAAELRMPVVAATGGEAAYGDAMLAALGVGSATPDDIAGWVQAATTSAASPT